MGLKSCCDGVAAAPRIDRRVGGGGEEGRPRKQGLQHVRTAQHILCCNLLYKTYVTLYSVYICMYRSWYIRLYIWVYTHGVLYTTVHTPYPFCDQSCSHKLIAMLSCACTEFSGCLWHRTLDPLHVLDSQPAGIIEPAPGILNIVTCTHIMILRSILVT